MNAPPLAELHAFGSRPRAGPKAPLDAATPGIALAGIGKKVARGTPGCYRDKADGRSAVADPDS